MDFDTVERFLKIIGDSSRLRILNAIGGGEKTVSEIIAETGFSQTLVSFHLKALRESRLVEGNRKGGPFVHYRLRDPSLVNFMESCDAYAGAVAGAREDIGRFEWPPWRMMSRGKEETWIRRK